MQSETRSEDRVVVGYFADGADAYRAINELIDEGFGASDIGAAFRTRRAGSGPQEVAATDVAPEGISGEMNNQTDDRTPVGDRNPGTTGSVGGAGSHDQAVTPAGLAPGSGNAFPGASRPGPIPGGEIPSTLKHDLPSTLQHELPSTMHSETSGAQTRAFAGSPAAIPANSGYGDRLHPIFHRNAEAEAETAGGPRLASGANNPNASANASNMNFGTGEGTLGLNNTYDYSESSFESSFSNMGLGAQDARSLSGELGRGGAVLTVTPPAGRAVLAEAIIERNHGRLRFENAESRERASEPGQVELYGRMHNYYRSEDDLRRAS